MSPERTIFGKIVFAFLSLLTLLSSSALGADNRTMAPADSSKRLEGQEDLSWQTWPKTDWIGYFAATTKGEAEAARAAKTVSRLR